MVGRKFNSLIFLFIQVIFAGCEQQGENQEVLTGEALGTSYQVKYFSNKDIDTKAALDSIFEVINASMSTYRENSDISRINAGDTTVRVDDHFKEVYNYSKKIYEESQGYFDPTVGNLVNAYGFGPERQFQEPNSTVLDSLVGLVGFNKLQLDEENRIKKEEEGIYLDFNAIAKGYAIDVIARYFDKRNVENYLVEVGGELVGKGKNIAKNSDWLVAIDDPEQEGGNRSFQTILALKDRAMATSGNYRKFRKDTATGAEFVHTINPKTGKAEKSNMLSASVLAENCTLADGYATAFMALGFEKSVEMLKDLEDVDAYFIYATEEGNHEVYVSEGFKEALRE